jgi:hypothetical protein
MTGWVGVVVFGGIMLLVLGGIHLIEGLVAVFKDDFFQVDPTALALRVGYVTWGWIHVTLGALAIVTGFGLFLGFLWARVFGVVLALLSAFATLLFVPAYPVGSIVAVGIAVLVIYALVTHGRDVRD